MIMIGMGFITRTEAVTKRGHDQIMKIVNESVAKRHRDQRLAKHFEDIPETKPNGGYGYRSRGKAYNKRKLRIHKHRRPNVFSGELRASAIRNVKAFGTKDKGVFRTRGTTTSRLARWQAAELSAMSNKERKTERKRTHREYAQMAKMRAYRSQRKRKVT